MLATLTGRRWSNAKFHHLNEIVLLGIFFFIGYHSNAQNELETNKGIWFQLSIGADKAIGKESISYTNGTLNPTIAVQKFDRKNYENPGVRFRVSAFYPLNNFILFGLHSGVTVHIGEMWGTSSYNLVSVPMQLQVNSLLVSRAGCDMYFDIAGGLNAFKAYATAYREQTGPLLSAGILVAVNKKIILRAGYEYQVDRGVAEIFADSGSGVWYEEIRFNQCRENIYLGFGITL